jgi:hypothetical protein
MANCVIEDCVVEQPAENNSRETTCIHVGSSEQPSTGIKAYPHGCVIRNCFVNGQYANGNEVEVESIDFEVGGNFTAVGTLTTKQPHGHVHYKNVVVRGATNATAQNPFNGVFPIEEIVSEKVLKYRMLAAPTENPQGPIWVGRGVSGHWVKIDNITQVNGLTYRIKTRLPHYRTDKNNVFVQGVILGISTANPYNGIYAVDAVHLDSNELEPTLLDYTLASAPGSGTLNFGQAFINAHFQAMSNDGGTGAVVEGNRVIGCRVGGPYHDSHSTRSIIVRNNYYRDVHTGPRQNLGGRGELKNVATLARDPNDTNGKTAICTTEEPHGFQNGHGVVMENAHIDGNTNNPLNGAFEVAVLGPTSFSYQMASDPGADPDASPLPQFATLWQVGMIIVENNVIELLKDREISTLPPVGINLSENQEFQNPYVFRKGIIRRNIIRQVDGLQEPGPVAISISSFEKAIVEKNVIGLARTDAMYHFDCGTVRYFNNRRANGQPIPGYERMSAGPPKVQSELRNKIEDAALLAV